MQAQDEAAWICNAFFRGETAINPDNMEAALRNHVSRLIWLQQRASEALVYVKEHQEKGRPQTVILSDLDELERRVRHQVRRWRSTRRFVPQPGDLADLVVTADKAGTQARAFFRLHRGDAPAQYAMSFNPLIDMSPTPRAFSLAVGKRPVSVARLAPLRGDDAPLSSTLVGQLLLSVQSVVHPLFDARAGQLLADRLTREGWKPDPLAEMDDDADVANLDAGRTPYGDEDGDPLDDC